MISGGIYVLDRLDPSHVAPAVGYPPSEENRDIDSVFVSGGYW